MIKASSTFTAKPLLDSKRFAKKFDTVFQGIGAEVSRELQPFVLEVYKPPGAVVYPIEWKTDRQRRAFFATDGFGRGIPTKRTGKVNSNWKVAWRSKQAFSGTIEVYNAVTYARFVYGGFNRQTQNQQPFHANTGWIQGAVGRSRIMPEADRLLRLKYDEALRGFGPLTGGA